MDAICVKGNSMHRLVRVSSGVVLALGLTSGTAMAELTAQQVWTSLESTFKGFGYSVTATEIPDDDGLTVSDIDLRYSGAEDDSRIRITMDGIDLIEAADGSVLMTLPAAIPISISATPEGDAPVTMMLGYGTDAMETVVSGEPGNMTYAFVANQLTMSLIDLAIDGKEISREDARFDLVFDDVTGKIVADTRDGVQIVQDTRAGSASYDLAFTNPDGGEAMILAGAMEAFAAESDSTLPEGFDSSDPQSLAAGGFAADGSVSYEDGQSQFAFTEDNGTTAGTTGSASVALDFSMDDTALSYSLGATGQTVSMSGPEMPVPLDFKMAETALNLTAPIAEADTPQDMAMGVALRGFELSDVIWNIIDPETILPRDAATIALDLTGKVTPGVNLFDPEAMARVEETRVVPGELNALTLNDLTVELAGATMGGTGSFTFDNEDMETFGGFPRPTGSVELTFDGVNALIDKLISMGLVTEEDAMGARMMMSMFAVPGDGEDSLKSSLTINEQGHVLANGMRIQ